MKLSEGAGKGRLAALVRSRDDKDSLFLLEVEVIADDGGLCRKQLVGKRYIKTVVGVDLFVDRDAWIANF